MREVAVNMSNQTQQQPLDRSTLSQWQLIRLRFLQHRLAVVSLFVLLGLYLVAFLAELFAPHGTHWKSVDHLYCPPQTVRFSISDGLHVLAMERMVDRETLRNYYLEKDDVKVPLRFFARGEPYRLWDILPWDRHLIGIPQEWKEAHPGQAHLATAYLLGADKFGRDILSRIIYGARISLSIGLVAISVSLTLGLLIGGISGYASGKTDLVIQRLMEIINAFPQLPMWLALGAALPKDWPALRNYFAITIVLSLLGWTGLARVVRGRVLSFREEDYAMAARLLGASHLRIILRHLIPGMSSHIIVSLTMSVPGMILGETALSFLGLGLRAPIVSWGVMLQDCINYQTVANYPWILLPVFVIIVTVLAFNFLGDGLRDAADPYRT